MAKKEPDSGSSFWSWVYPTVEHQHEQSNSIQQTISKNQSPETSIKEEILLEPSTNRVENGYDSINSMINTRCDASSEISSNLNQFHNSNLDASLPPDIKAQASPLDTTADNSIHQNDLSKPQCTLPNTSPPLVPLLGNSFSPDHLAPRPLPTQSQPFIIPAPSLDRANSSDIPHPSLARDMSPITRCTAASSLGPSSLDMSFSEPSRERYLTTSPSLSLSPSHDNSSYRPYPGAESSLEHGAYPELLQHAQLQQPQQHTAMNIILPTQPTSQLPSDTLHIPTSQLLINNNNNNTIVAQPDSDSPTMDNWAPPPLEPIPVSTAIPHSGIATRVPLPLSSDALNQIPRNPHINSNNKSPSSSALKLPSHINAPHSRENSHDSSPESSTPPSPSLPPPSILAKLPQHTRSFLSLTLLSHLWQSQHSHVQSVDSLHNTLLVTKHEIQTTYQRLYYALSIARIQIEHRINTVSAMITRVSADHELLSQELERARAHHHSLIDSYTTQYRSSIVNTPSLLDSIRPYLTFESQHNHQSHPHHTSSSHKPGYSPSSHSINVPVGSRPPNSNSASTSHSHTSISLDPIIASLVPHIVVGGRPAAPTLSATPSSHSSSFFPPKPSPPGSGTVTPHHPHPNPVPPRPLHHSVPIKSAHNMPLSTSNTMPQMPSLARAPSGLSTVSMGSLLSTTPIGRHSTHLLPTPSHHHHHPFDHSNTTSSLPTDPEIFINLMSYMSRNILGKLTNLRDHVLAPSLKQTIIVQNTVLQKGKQSTDEMNKIWSEHTNMRQSFVSSWDILLQTHADMISLALENAISPPPPTTIPPQNDTITSSNPTFPILSKTGSLVSLLNHTAITSTISAQDKLHASLGGMCEATHKALNILNRCLQSVEKAYVGIAGDALHFAQRVHDDVTSELATAQACFKEYIHSVLYSSSSPQYIHSIYTQQVHTTVKTELNSCIANMTNATPFSLQHGTSISGSMASSSSSKHSLSHIIDQSPNSQIVSNPSEALVMALYTLYVTKQFQHVVELRNLRNSGISHQTDSVTYLESNLKHIESIINDLSCIVPDIKSIMRTARRNLTSDMANLSSSSSYIPPPHNTPASLRPQLGPRRESHNALVLDTLSSRPSIIASTTLPNTPTMTSHHPRASGTQSDMSSLLQLPSSGHHHIPQQQQFYKQHANIQPAPSPSHGNVEHNHGSIIPHHKTDTDLYWQRHSPQITADNHQPTHLHPSYDLPISPSENEASVQPRDSSTIEQHHALQIPSYNTNSTTHPTRPSLPPLLLPSLSLLNLKVPSPPPSLNILRLLSIKMVASVYISNPNGHWKPATLVLTHHPSQCLIYTRPSSFNHHSVSIDPLGYVTRIIDPDMTPHDTHSDDQQVDYLSMMVLLSSLPQPLVKIPLHTDVKLALLPNDIALDMTNIPQSSSSLSHIPQKQHLSTNRNNRNDDDEDDHDSCDSRDNDDHLDPILPPSEYDNVMGGAPLDRPTTKIATPLSRPLPSHESSIAQPDVPRLNHTTIRQEEKGGQSGGAGTSWWNLGAIVPTLSSFGLPTGWASTTQVEQTTTSSSPEHTPSIKHELAEPRTSSISTTSSHRNRTSTTLAQQSHHHPLCNFLLSLQYDDSKFKLLRTTVSHKITSHDKTLIIQLLNMIHDGIYTSSPSLSSSSSSLSSSSSSVNRVNHKS